MSLARVTPLFLAVTGFRAVGYYFEKGMVSYAAPKKNRRTCFCRRGTESRVSMTVYGTIPQAR